MAPSEPAPMIDARRYGHVCPDAFLLMPYTCDLCRAVEWVWNSRDGVTPYIIDCCKCGGRARHRAMRQDRYEPGYRPQRGERFFVDATPEDYRQRAEQAFERAKGTPYEIPEAQKEPWIQAAIRDWQAGEPKLVVVGKNRTARTAKGDGDPD